MRNGARMPRQHVQGDRLRPLTYLGKSLIITLCFHGNKLSNLQLLKLNSELDITGVPGSVAIVVESKETVP